MKKATNFYHIGLFTILGITLLVIFILALGGKSWFQRPVYVETYFNESVQGLEIGSAVKYRGVRIGKVTDIDFVNDVYNKATDKLGKKYFNHYVYVLMAINLDMFSKRDQRDISAIFNEAIRNGMRVRLTSQGLTGSSYLELDFYNAKRNPPLPISWIPTHPYIPSKLSTFSQITDNLNKFMAEISKANVPQIMRNIDHATGQTSQVMSKINVILSDQQQNIESSLTDIHAVTSNLRTITSNAKSDPSSLLFSAKPKKLDLNNEKSND